MTSAKFRERLSTNSLRLPSLTELKAEKCRRSFYFFVQEFWSTIIEEPPVWNWHIEYLCKELQHIAIRVKNREPFEYPYYIINIPPGSSKSTICSQMFIAWCWTIDPTMRFICASYSQTIARKDSTFTQSIINSDQYKRYFPDIELTKDAVDLLRNTRNGERYATTPGGSSTGLHAHLVVLDDIINPKESASEAERRTVKDWLDITLPTRKIDKKITPTILVMQRLHEDDATGHILNKGVSVKHICLPAELSDEIRPDDARSLYTNGLLDPIRLDHAVLSEMRKTLGSYGYSGQFEQRPAPAEGGMIKRAYFNIVDAHQIPRSDVNFFLDSAYGDADSDYSAIFAYIISSGNLYIVNAAQVRLEFPELIKFIPRFVEDSGYTNQSMIYVEPKSSGKSIVQTLRVQTSLNIKEDVSPTKDKVARVEDILAPLDAGRLFMLRGGWNAEVIDQCAVFPNGKQDGYVDCLSASGRRAFLKKGLRWM